MKSGFIMKKDYPLKVKKQEKRNLYLKTWQIQENITIKNNKETQASLYKSDTSPQMPLAWFNETFWKFEAQWTQANYHKLQGEITWVITWVISGDKPVPFPGDGKGTIGGFHHTTIWAVHNLDGGAPM